MDLFDLFLTKAITGGGSPSPEPVLIDKEITENGTYNAAQDDGADGYMKVTVNVDLKSFSNFIVNAELNER